MTERMVFSLEETLARVEHDHELFEAMAAVLVEQGPKDLAAAHAALATHDAQALARAAHRLKGALLQFSAPAAAEASIRLEELGQYGDLELAGAAYAQLEAELGRLLSALHDHLRAGRGL